MTEGTTVGTVSVSVWCWRGLGFICLMSIRMLDITSEGPRSSQYTDDHCLLIRCLLRLTHPGQLTSTQLRSRSHISNSPLATPSRAVKPLTTLPQPSSTSTRPKHGTAASETVGRLCPLTILFVGWPGLLGPFPRRRSGNRAAGCQQAGRATTRSNLFWSS
jgi:hypothetical protein